MYEEIKLAQAAGMVTIEKPIVEAPQPIPISEERIVVTSKRFSPITGLEVEPAVQTIYKRDLEREKKSLEDQKARIEAQIVVVDEMLKNFEPAKPVLSTPAFEL